jgi:putative sigma-54 modulation protein
MNHQNIIITGLHLDLTDAIKNAIYEKFSKLFRHDEHIIRMRVEVEHLSHRSPEAAFICKAHIEINGPDLVVSAATEDLYRSIDEVLEKLDRKLRRKHRIDRVKRKNTHEIETDGALSKKA